MQQLNELRRQALEKLELEICGKFRRTSTEQPLLKQKSEEKHAAELLAEAKRVKEQLEKEENRLQFTEKVGPDGRTFGSITAKKIAEGLQKQLGIKIDKRHIELEHPIRAIGLIEVPVKLHKEVNAQIKLNIKNSAE